MELLLCRHGEASFDAPSDSLRCLTDHGKAVTDESARSSRKALERASVMWTSDLLRAKQTAAILQKYVALNYTEHPFLRPESNPVGVLRALRELSRNEARSDSSRNGHDAVMIVVAHMPLLGQLYSLLVHGHLYEPYPFQTSEIVHLRAELVEAGLFEEVKS